MQEINEPYYQLYLNSDNFIDMTDNLTCIVRTGATILGEHRCGKSTFLSMVRCCLDKKLSFTDMFGEEAAEKVRKEIYEELNTFHVILSSIAKPSGIWYSITTLSPIIVIYRQVLPNHRKISIYEGRNMENCVTALFQKNH